MNFKCYVCEKLTPIEEGIFILGHDHCKECYNKIYKSRPKVYNMTEIKEYLDNQINWYVANNRGEYDNDIRILKKIKDYMLEDE